MADLRLSGGQVAVVDGEDFEECQSRSWAVSGSGYAHSYVSRRKYIYLHKFIGNERMGLKGRIDHKDGDGLNCRRGNLRPCTHSQNMANREVQKNNRLGVKGVCFDSQTGRYRAQLRCNGKKINIGRFPTMEEAKAAYDSAGKHYFGDFFHS